MPDFKAGDKVRLKSDPYYMDGDTTEMHTSLGRVFRNNPHTVFVVDSGPDHDGDYYIYTEDQDDSGYANGACLKPEQEPEPEPDLSAKDPEAVYNLVLVAAKELDEAIANGTMVPRLSSLGFLVEFVRNYESL